MPHSVSHSRELIYVGSTPSETTLASKLSGITTSSTSSEITTGSTSSDITTYSKLRFDVGESTDPDVETEHQEDEPAKRRQTSGKEERGKNKDLGEEKKKKKSGFKKDKAGKQKEANGNDGKVKTKEKGDEKKKKDGPRDLKKAYKKMTNGSSSRHVDILDAIALYAVQERDRKNSKKSGKSKK